MADYVRVKLKGIDHKVTILRSQFNAEGMTELKQDAVDEHGVPLAPEFPSRTKSPSNQSGQKATTTPKES